MNRILKIVLILILLMFIYSFFYDCNLKVAYAEDDSYGQYIENFESTLDEQTKKSVGDYLPDEAKDYKPSDISLAEKLDFVETVKKIWNYFTAQLEYPLLIMGQVMGIVILCSVAKSLAVSLCGTFEIISTLGCSVVIYSAVNSTVQTVVKTLEDMQLFMTGYIPIFSGVCMASGAAANATQYHGTMFVLCQIIAVVTSKLLVPFISLILATAVVTAINPSLTLGNTAGSIKTAVNWVLGLVMTIFTGIMSIKSFAFSSVDSVSVKTMKFVASGFIPIIGSAISDSYSVIKGSLGVIKTGAGIFAIIIICIIVIRPIIMILASKFILGICTVICDLLGQSSASGLIKNVNAVLSMLTATLICFSLMFIISTAILIMTSQGG